MSDRPTELRSPDGHIECLGMQCIASHHYLHRSLRQCTTQSQSQFESFLVWVNMFVSEQQYSQNFFLHVLFNDPLLTQVLHYPVDQVGEVLHGDVQHHGAGLDVDPQVDHGVEGEGGDVRFAPLALLCLEVFLVLDPPARL